MNDEKKNVNIHEDMREKTFFFFISNASEVLILQVFFKNFI